MVVRVENLQGMLRVSVEDTGQGFADNGSSRSSDGTGVGLANVRRRLNLSYGPEATLDVYSSERGCRVTFAIPAATPSETANQEVEVGG